MNSSLVQRLELDILQIKREVLALEIISNGAPGEFTRQEENKAMAKLMTSCAALAISALTPSAFLMQNDPEHFAGLMKIISESALRLVKTMNAELEAQNG